MGTRRFETDLVEELRLPVGGSFIITDELGNELFRVTAAGDAVKVSGQTVVPADIAKLVGAGALVASGTQHAHIADAGNSATGTQLATAINAIIDALEAFGLAAAA